MSRARAWCWLVLFALLACEREVTVEMATDGFTILPPIGGAAGSGVGGTDPQSGAGSSGIAGAGIPGSPAMGGMHAIGSGGQSHPSGGDGGDGAGGAGGAGPAAHGLLAGIEQAQPGAMAALEGFEVLSDRVTSIERLALGTDGVSLVQYDQSGNASTLHVTWDGRAETWHGSSGAFDAFVAASLDRHVSLLHAERYPILAGGGGAELSGTPVTYKEQLAASTAGLAWVDYPSPIVNTPARQSFGELVLLRGDGTRAVLSDRSRYRAGIALSATHAAYVEYERTEPGSFGQLVVVPLSGGPAFAVAPSTWHQDHPALDGDWLVFEEYRSSRDAVIRACNLATGEVRDLSSAQGFRMRADVSGARVVWEDYRDGTADLYLADLGAGGEQPVVTGAGHSATPRLTGDGVVWLEAQGNKAAIVRARFRAP